MIAEPTVFHDKHLIGNGECCGHCGGTGRTKGTRGPATSRRCKPCKGSGRAPLPAEVIVANTRPRAAQAALMQAARDARDAAEISDLREALQAEAEKAAKPVEVICGVPMPVQFGRRDDDSVWLSCGVERVEQVHLEFSGTVRAASALATLLNGLPGIRDALKAAHSECRDPHLDSQLSNATGDLIETALRALEVRL